MTVSKSGTFTAFGGCDLIAFRYNNRERELLGEIGAITWSPGLNNNYQGSLYFTCFDFPSTIESILPPEKFWVRINFLNEYGQSHRVEFFNVVVDAKRLQKGEPVRFTCTHIE